MRTLHYWIPAAVEAMTIGRLSEPSRRLVPPTWGSPQPHLHRDWAHPCHICTGTGLTPATSTTGLCPPLPLLLRDCARPVDICTGTTWAHRRHICSGTFQVLTGVLRAAARRGAHREPARKEGASYKRRQPVAPLSKVGYRPSLRSPVPRSYVYCRTGTCYARFVGMRDVRCRYVLHDLCQVFLWSS
jgi:hypothetical protein